MSKFISFAGHTIAVDKILFVSPVIHTWDKLQKKARWDINISLLGGEVITDTYFTADLAKDVRAIIEAALVEDPSQEEVVSDVDSSGPVPTDWTKVSAQEVADEINRRYELKNGKEVIICGVECIGIAYVDIDGEVCIKHAIGYPWYITCDREFTDMFKSILS